MGRTEEWIPVQCCKRFTSTIKIFYSTRMFFNTEGKKHKILQEIPETDICTRSLPSRISNKTCKEDSQTSQAEDSEKTSHLKEAETKQLLG